MKKYIKDGKTIRATDKMYRLIYKDQGYIHFDEQEQVPGETDREYENLEALSVEDLKALCDEQGIEYKAKIKRDELIQLLEGVQ